MARHVEPSVSQTAFNCPHCGTLTTQTWWKLYSTKYPNENKVPFLGDASVFDRIEKEKELSDEQRAKFRAYFRQLMAGDLFFNTKEDEVYLNTQVGNLNITQCYECGMLTIWLHDSMLYPNTRSGIEPNEDLDQEIKHDFNEAREILDKSPRGAAALLRLAVQKLCKQLGESGANIDDDIASLVGKGLNPLVQKSLDVVRVVGNEAVHPGTLDLKDDRDTAVQLLELINSIASQMISHPKHVESLYGRLPAAKLAGIDVRNAKAIKKATDADD